MNEMIHFTFGHPTGVPVGEPGQQRALAVWYSGDDERTGIYGAHLKLETAG